MAAALLARGLRPGDRVAVWASNSARWALTALACFHVGLTLVPISTRYRGAEAHDLLARGRARALFVEHRDQLEAARATGPLPDLDTVVPITDGPSWAEFLADGTPVDAPLDAAVEPDTVLQIMFTSGTTGRPKGVPHTHGQVVRLYDRYSRAL